MPNNGGLQLLPETRRKIDVYIPGQNRWLIIAGAWLGLVLLIWGGLFLYRRSVVQEIGAVDAALEALEQTRRPAEEEKLLKLKDAIAAAKPLLDQHVIWSAAFARIERLVLAPVQFETLTAKLERKQYVFKAQAANFMTVARQIAAFNNDTAIISAEVSKLTAKPDGRVEFNANLTLDLEKINRPLTPTPTPTPR